MSWFFQILIVAFLMFAVGKLSERMGGMRPLVRVVMVNSYLCWLWVQWRFGPARQQTGFQYFAWTNMQARGVTEYPRPSIDRLAPGEVLHDRIPQNPLYSRPYGFGSPVRSTMPMTPYHTPQPQQQQEARDERPLPPPPARLPHQVQSTPTAFADKDDSLNYILQPTTTAAAQRPPPPQQQERLVQQSFVRNRWTEQQQPLQLSRQVSQPQQRRVPGNSRMKVEPEHAKRQGEAFAPERDESELLGQSLRPKRTQPAGSLDRAARNNIHDEMMMVAALAAGASLVPGYKPLPRDPVNYTSVIQQLQHQQQQRPQQQLQQRKPTVVGSSSSSSTSSTTTTMTTRRANVSTTESLAQEQQQQQKRNKKEVETMVKVTERQEVVERGVPPRHILQKMPQDPANRLYPSIPLSGKKPSIRSSGFKYPAGTRHFDPPCVVDREAVLAETKRQALLFPPSTESAWASKDATAAAVTSSSTSSSVIPSGSTKTEPQQQPPKPSETSELFVVHVNKTTEQQPQQLAAATPPLDDNSSPTVTVKQVGPVSVAPTTATFSFGGGAAFPSAPVVAPMQPAPSKGDFNLGAFKIPEPKPEVKAPTTTAQTFNFGGPVQAAPKNNDLLTVNQLAAATSTAAPPTQAAFGMFGVKQPTQQQQQPAQHSATVAAAPPMAGFSFGPQPSSQPVPAQPALPPPPPTNPAPPPPLQPFAPVAPSSSSTTATATNLFGTTQSSSGFAFPSSTTAPPPKPQQAPANTNPFGGPATTTQSSVAATGGGLFGGPVPQSLSSASSAPFGSFAPAAASSQPQQPAAPAFGGFGGVSAPAQQPKPQQQPAASSTSLFSGTAAFPSAPAPAATAGGLFGGPAPQSSASNATLPFGGPSSSSSSSSASSSLFGTNTAVQQSTASNPPFFGAPSATTQPTTAPAFGLPASSSSAPAAAPAAFSFGGPVAPTQAATTTSAAPALGGLFGAPPSAPAPFGGFGSTTASATPFGAPSAFAPVAAPAPSTAAPAGGLFNAAAPQGLGGTIFDSGTSTTASSNRRGGRFGRR